MIDKYEEQLLKIIDKLFESGQISRHMRDTWKKDVKKHET